ncbi:hypothetical protein CAPTEDRAFT_193716 [Capitella teleta]|uniref:Centrosomal protein of 70 kDa n=1 Tax=Capitella teleta TaxID=283909 RepID=R7U7Z6_CAPTE|nr:hypothetical protein CAPTEDRAFT_193716 [Capitella teleta]|eukprot:ELT99245.1 hypothetical protein CAPTEDRAFT_193716 [Capitella teleta]
MDTKEINLSISESLFQMEQDDWQTINKELRHHGLAPVELENLLTVTQTSDAVVLSAEMSRRLRQSISTLAKDCDRRQELIQELIQTNNHLRDELKEQNYIVEKQEHRVNELKKLLESSKQKVKELEDDRLSSSNLLQQEEEKFHQTKVTIAATCDQLQNSCVKYQQELRSLKSKMNKMHQDTERDLHTSKLLEQLKKRATAGNLEEKVVNLISSYEGQIGQLRHQVDLFEMRPPGGSSGLRENLASTPLKKDKTHKSLIKTYERQLRDVRKKCKILEEKNELLALELESRPDLKDFRDSQIKVKKLQRSLKDKYQNGRNQSMQTDDMEPLTLQHLQINSDEEILKLIQQQLKAETTEDILPILKKNSKTLFKLEEFAGAVIHLSQSCHFMANKQSKKHEIWCEKTRHGAITAFESCLKNLQNLPDLQKLLVELSCILMVENAFSSDDPSVENMMHGVQKLLKTSKNKLTSISDSEKYQAIVSHFQELFDVKCVDGIFSRMNEIYVKLGEMHSVLRNLKHLLGLDDTTSSSQLIDHIACLTPDSRSQQINELFQVDTLEEVAQRIDEQEQFISIFQPLVHCLIEELHLNTVDQILPTVKALQVLVRNSHIS